jgi:uncharacterized protein (DUF305 family)
VTLLDERSDAPSAPPIRRRVTRVVVVVIALAALVIAVAVGYVWGGSGSSGTAGSPGSAYPTARSVDAGFARDMATHHQQAITMATYAERHTDDVGIKALAYDIESNQSVQMGEMIGWVSEWGVSRNTSAPMSWMPMHGMAMSKGMSGDNGALMPGMATAAQMSRLLSSSGHALDVLFLQLMIRHHQGGLPMARYAAAHASVPAVRMLAENMAVTQSREIGQMKTMLAHLGGKPLPPPS